MIGTFIYKALTDNAAVIAIVSTRVYPVVIPQTNDLPALVYSIGSAVPSHTNDGSSKLDKFQFQVYCLARSYAAVDNLAAKVRVALHGYKTPIIQEIRYNTEMDDYEESTMIFVRVMTFDLRLKII